MSASRRVESILLKPRNGAREEPVELHVEADEDGRWPLLMVHGFGDNLHTWQELREILRERGARCVRLDLPGFGGSPLPSFVAEQYVLESARIVLAAARRWCAKKNVASIGNSLGASVLLCAAALESQGSGTPTIGSAVLLSPATLDTRTPPFVRLLRIPTYKWAERLGQRAPERSWRAAVRLLVRLTIRGMFAPNRRPPADWVASVVDALAEPEAWRRLELVALDLRRILRREAGEVEALLDRDVVARIPIVLARGVHDPVIGAAELDALARKLPAGRRIEMPGVGHCPQIEDPEETARIVLETREA